MIRHRQGEQPREYQWILRPNASLNRRQAKMLIGVMGLGMAAIGTGFALAGAWPVLPFSGAELWLLGYGLTRSMRESAIREIITLDREKLRIERAVPDVERFHEFLRAWVRIEWSGPTRLNECGRLYVGSHGKQVEIGAFLIEEEKQALAQSLQQALSSEF
ncbi:DUF2244 domain-containing protein [Methylohalobius crimeensis]|uniref:DUF2244 domain-containing protein n=1 Tax=Methylohalobius crimeensis TaxID=244365 RepID=UPI0003B786F2|nr:DUF2244 domain-containing protein [Methylohalobius crimeensis]